MMNLFSFSKQGVKIGAWRHYVQRCYLGKPVVLIIDLSRPREIPPICHIDGVDLVTEGVVTISRVSMLLALSGRLGYRS